MENVKKDYARINLALNPRNEHHAKVAKILNEVKSNRFDYGTLTDYICKAILDYDERSK